MNAAVERALAELRAIPMRETAAPEPQPAESECSCTGDERGYQWHQRNGNLPACKPALEAHRVFTREYLREWRKRNPKYHQNWRAQRQNKGGAA